MAEYEFDLSKLNFDEYKALVEGDISFGDFLDLLKKACTMEIADLPVTEIPYIASDLMDYMAISVYSLLRQRENT